MVCVVSTTAAAGSDSRARQPQVIQHSLPGHMPEHEPGKPGEPTGAIPSPSPPSSFKELLLAISLLTVPLGAGEGDGSMGPSLGIAAHPPEGGG